MVRLARRLMIVPDTDFSPVLTGSICALTLGDRTQNPTQAADHWFAQLGRSDYRESENSDQPASSVDANVSLESQAEYQAATSHSVFVPTDSPDRWNETQPPVARMPRSVRLLPALIALMLCIALGVWGWWSQTRPADALVTTGVRQVEASSPAGLQPKRIEQIVVGDHVWARDPATGELALRRVEAVFHRSSDHLRHLTFTDATGGSQTLSTTDEHPFFVVDPSGSTPGIEVTAGELAIGDEVLQLDGTASIVTETRHEVVPGGVPVYNFRVAGFHTYHVSASPRGPPLWVHNAGCEGDPEVFNITPPAQGKGPIVGLGKSRHIAELGDVSIAKNRGWTKDGLTSWDSDSIEEFEAAFRETLANANAIHFNLNGVSIRRVWLEAGELAGPLSARSKGLVTEWELRQIIDDRNLLEKTTFFINGRSVRGNDYDNFYDLLLELNK
ncbi:hypothetical protein Pla100_35280 [Neorhodopirellula pilleata]|uniref:Hint domain-containing protein n=2 Tax=Neorhodopirellula pilleata TaxID=2714738 RepID=A0A5C6A616_9BACT|nr:hypothetical protein Pla100_35280 [Neorhodopirellula pilleata]